MAELGRPPKVNDEVFYNDSVRLTVLDVDRRAVSRVRVEFPDPDEEQNGEETTEE